MTEKKISKYEKEDDYMTEALGKIKTRIDVVERDVEGLKDDNKEFYTFRELFQQHIVRDDEQKKVLNVAIDNLSKTMDGIKDLCASINTRQNETDKELLRIELSEELRSEQEKTEYLKRQLEKEKTNFSSRLWRGFQDKAITIIVSLTIGGGFLFVLYKMLENFITIAPK